MAMEGSYPIMIDGELAGKLTVTAQGARTVFDARCRMCAGIVRLSVYGGGTEGYLGVLAPEGEELSLHKTITRTELEAFPQQIECVERSGRPEAVPAAETPKAEEKKPSEETVEEAEEAEEDTMFWYTSPDGALVCFDGESSLIALPVGDDRIPSGYGGKRRMIEGKEYIVYITKNGRVIR